jgi:hypothetical protein
MCAAAAAASPADALPRFVRGTLRLVSDPRGATGTSRAVRDAAADIGPVGARLRRAVAEQPARRSPDAERAAAGRVIAFALRAPDGRVRRP